MSFFKKKSKKVSQAVIYEETKKQPISIPEEQRRMDSARSTLDEIIEKMREMQTSEFSDNMLYAANKKQEIVDYNKKVIDNLREIDPDFIYNSINKRRIDIEEGLYILPPDLNDYQEQINTIIELFEHYTAASTRVTGADEINRSLLKFVNELKEALNDAQKKKADVVLKALKYAIVIVNEREPSGANEKQKRATLEKRKQNVDEYLWNAVVIVNKIYGTLSDLQKADSQYAKDKKQFDEKKQQVDLIPEEYKQIIDELGFAKSKEKYYKNQVIREYLDISIEASVLLAMARTAENARESCMKVIETCQKELETIMCEADKSFNEQGNDYDSAEIKKLLGKIHAHSIEEISKSQNIQLSFYNMHLELASRLNAVIANPEKADAASLSMREIKEHEDLQKSVEKANHLRAQKAQKIKQEREQAKKEQEYVIDEVNDQDNKQELYN